MPAMPLSMFASRVRSAVTLAASGRGGQETDWGEVHGLRDVQRLFRHEAASGVVLMLASAFALVLANSPFAGLYDLLLSVHGAVRIGGLGIDKPMLLWINDGLDGDILSSRRSGNKARGAGGRAFRPQARDPAGRGGDRRNDRAGSDLSRHHAERAGRNSRLGDPLRNRYRVLAGRNGAVRQPGRALPQALSDRARDHRRSRRHRGHRDLLHRGAFLALVGRRTGGARYSRRAQPRRRAAGYLVRARRHRTCGCSC